MWFHLFVTWDGSLIAANVHTYINNIEVSYATQDNGTGNLDAPAGAWSLGGGKPQDNANLDGGLAAIGWWDRVLSADERAILAAGCSPRFILDGINFAPDLIRSQQDVISGEAGTLDGTDVRSHPPILFPTSSYTVPEPKRAVFPDEIALTLTLQAPTILPNTIVTPSTLELVTILQTPDINYDYTVILGSELDLTLTLQESVVSIFYPDIPFFMQEDLIDPYSGGAWLWLVEIVVTGQTTQRIARNTENIVYDGDTFDRFNFDVSPQMFSSEGDIPRVTLRVFQDINRRVEDIINNAEGALGGQIKLIRVNEKFLDTPVRALEYDYDNLASQSDTEWVVFTLGMPNPLTQRIPLDTYNSSICSQATPTLFKGSRCQYTGDDTSCTGTYDDCRGKDNAEHWGGELGLDPNVMRI